MSDGLDGNFFIAIAAVNTAGIKSGLSNVIVRTIDGDTMSVTLSWTPPTTNIDGTTYSNPGGYIIYYGPSSNPSQGTIEINDPNITSYIINNPTI
ncbi:MAG: fibronectin type III domain-containing protein [Gammaproteobacteria bacterium]|nr:fibronectin type III domain-containing protein [Gammaproteobacteria bacterium]